MKFLSICILANLEFAKAEIVALQQRVDSTVYKCELWMHKARDKVFVSPEVHHRKFMSGAQIALVIVLYSHYS